jgi:alpha-tubulin suppressor-like RCC1 family protein
VALRERVFPGGELIPRTRPFGCTESWVSYLMRFARQRRYRDAPPISAGYRHSLFVDSAGRLRACGVGEHAGDGDEGADVNPFPPALVAAMASVRVRSVASGWYYMHSVRDGWGYSLALGWDGRLYSWGENTFGQLGHGDRLRRPSPASIQGFAWEHAVAANSNHSFSVSQSGVVFRWGRALKRGVRDSLRPIVVHGFGAVRVRRVCAGLDVAFAVGEEGQLFSWGCGRHGILGHGGTQNQPSPKRVEGLHDFWVSSVAAALRHALALTDDGMVFSWGENFLGATLGNPDVASKLWPTPVEALGGVRVGIIAAAGHRSYAVADTGQLWAWGGGKAPLGHGERISYPEPKPIESLRGVKVDAVAAGYDHTLAVADDGSVNAWGNEQAASSGALGLEPSVSGPRNGVRTPQRIMALRVACEW